MIYKITIDILRRINLCAQIFGEGVKFLNTSFKLKRLHFLQILSKSKYLK